MKCEVFCFLGVGTHCGSNLAAKFSKIAIVQVA